MEKSGVVWKVRVSAMVEERWSSAEGGEKWSCAEGIEEPNSGSDTT